MPPYGTTRDTEYLEDISGKISCRSAPAAACSISICNVMKFLLLCHNYTEYGTFFRAFQLGKHLVKSGHLVVLMLISQDKAFGIRRYDREGVWIIECPNFQPFIKDKEDGWGILDILIRCVYGITHRFNIIMGFGHKPDIAVPAMLLKYLKGVTFVSDWCDLWGENGIFTIRGMLQIRYWGTLPDRVLVRIDAFLEKFVLRKADIVTVICNPLKELCGKWRISPDKILLLPSGSDGEAIKLMNKKLARRKLNLPRGKILAYLGNYHQEAKFLFESFERIARERNDILLLIIGPEYPPAAQGEELQYKGKDIWEGRKKYRSLPVEVKDRIVWVGKKPYDEIYRYLAAADVLLLPMEDNQFERGRWPNKLCDYLAGGRPIVTTDVGDAGKFIRENGCGLVTKAAIADYCNVILANIDDEALLEQMGSRARSLAEGKRSWQNITAKLLEFTAGRRPSRIKESSRMRKCMSKILLAAYTILVIFVEGIYLLLAWSAIKLGWVPKKKER